MIIFFNQFLLIILKLYHNLHNQMELLAKCLCSFLVFLVLILTMPNTKLQCFYKLCFFESIHKVLFLIPENDFLQVAKWHKNISLRVADKILEIADNNTWQLRHPVGPDALPFLQWRASMTDEEYVDWNAATDEEWYTATENTFGLNVRQG